MSPVNQVNSFDYFGFCKIKMGNCCTCAESPPSIVFLGLCDSGKSSIIAYIEYKAFRLTHPTLGVSISSSVYEDSRVEIWDVSGRDCSFWSKYYAFPSGMAFVIDGLREDLLDTFVSHAKNALENDHVQTIPILIYINRYHGDGTEIVNNIKDKLDLNLRPGLCIHFQLCDVKSGKGVLEGYNWLMSRVIRI